MQPDMGIESSDLSHMLHQVFEGGVVRTQAGEPIVSRTAYCLMQTADALIKDDCHEVLSEILSKGDGAVLSDRAVEILGFEAAHIVAYGPNTILPGAIKVLGDIVAFNEQTGLFEMDAQHYINQFQDKANRLGLRVGFERNSMRGALLPVNDIGEDGPPDLRIVSNEG